MIRLLRHSSKSLATAQGCFYAGNVKRHCFMSIGKVEEDVPLTGEIQVADPALIGIIRDEKAAMKHYISNTGKSERDKAFQRIT